MTSRAMERVPSQKHNGIKTSCLLFLTYYFLNVFFLLSENVIESAERLWQLSFDKKCIKMDYCIH